MKIYRIWGICLLIGLLLTGCGKEELPEGAAQSTAYSIYYLNADATKLEKRAYEPKEETKNVMIQEMLLLLDEQEPEGSNLTLLPKGVEIMTYEIQDKTITIDFSADYNKMSADREVLVRAGIVRMFLQVPGIVYVKFTVGGQEILDGRGNAVGIMSNDTFAEQSGGDINSYQYTTLTLYFTNEAGDMLVQEKRSVYYSRNISLEQVVLEQLLKGPRLEGSYATLPADVNILGITSTDGNCYVNLDQNFVDNALPVQAKIPVYSIVNSLVDACKVEQVKISVNGESNVIFRESMNLDKFYKKTKRLVETPEAEDEELLQATPANQPEE